MTWALLVGSAVLWTAPVAAKTPKMAVLDLKTSGTFEPAMVSGLSSVVAAEASRFAVQVVSGSDVRAMIGFERERQLLGCSDQGCLAEIAGALGVEYLLASEVSQVGDVWMLSLALIDVTKTQTLARVVRRASRAGGLVDAASAGVPELLLPHLPRKPGAELKIATDSLAPRRGTLGYVLDVGGGALLAGGAAFGILALDSYREAKKLSSSPDRAAFDSAASRAKSRALVADVLLTAGVLTGSAGAYLTLRSSRASQAVSATVVPLGDGAAVLVTARL